MHVLKFPWADGGGKKSAGASYGPDAIERQFKKFSWRCSEDGVPAADTQFLDLKELVNRKELETMHAAFARAVGSILAQKNNSLVVLSGDNSCSFYTVRNIAERFSDPNLVAFDAHPDACDGRHDPHASWLRRLWETWTVKPEKTFLFGIRDLEEAEREYLKGKKASVYSADTLFSTEPAHIVSELQFSKKLDMSSALILVIDIDALDPSQAPATGVLRAPGLDLRQVLRFVRAFGELPFPAKVGEICEVIPAEGNQLRPPDDRRPDPSGLTVLAAEAILRQMLRSFAS